MNVKELRDKTVAELNVELIRLRKEDFSLRMQKASGQLGQTHLLKTNRRDIAQVKTVMREKQSG